eukprot:12065885-Alexandrium_andersonii.AAC.1
MSWSWRSWNGTGSNISVSSGPHQSVGTLVLTSGRSSALLAQGPGPSQALPRNAACTAGAPGPLTGETNSVNSRATSWRTDPGMSLASSA